MKPPVDRLMLGQARAEVAELRAQLAAANALIGFVADEIDRVGVTVGRIDVEKLRAHLAARPATAPATFEHPGAEQVFNELRAARQPTAPARDEGEAK